MINQLLEKYLEGYKVTAKQIADVYVNPTRREYDDIDYTVANLVRFIADKKNKNVYVWDSGIWIHKLAWGQIRKTIGDSRQLYKDDTLLSGEYNTSNHSLDMYYAANYNSDRDIQTFLNDDWSWMDKYMKDFNKNMKIDLKAHFERK